MLQEYNEANVRGLNCATHICLCAEKWKHVYLCEAQREGAEERLKCLRNSMSSSHLFSGDTSSDLKAEIINEGRPTQTNTHIHTLGAVGSATRGAYAEQEVYDGMVEHD